MKTLTIHQPYAHLVMTGEKKLETRGRRTNVRGRIAIHASASIVLPQFASPKVLDYPGLKDLPRGVILGTVELIDCIQISTVDFQKHVAILHRLEQWIVKGDEFEYGNYVPGNYVWVFANPIALDVPVPAKGQQGWWNWKGILAS